MESLPVKIQVLIVENQPLVRAGITAILSAAGDMNVTGVAADAHAAAELLRSPSAHVVVLGTNGHRTERLAAVATLAAAAPSTRILVVADPREAADPAAYLAAGAAGVVEDSASPELFVYTVRGAADGLADGSGLGIPSDPDGLSTREGEVARLIVRGYGNKDIASQLRLSVKTVETYKARLMQKLGVSSRAALVDRGLRRGWLAQH